MILLSSHDWGVLGFFYSDTEKATPSVGLASRRISFVSNNSMILASMEKE